MVVGGTGASLLYSTGTNRGKDKEGNVYIVHMTSFKVYGFALSTTAVTGYSGYSTCVLRCMYMYTYMYMYMCMYIHVHCTLYIQCTCTCV